MVDRHNCFYDLKEHLSADTCPVCRLTQKTIDSFIAGLFFEQMNEYGFREALNRSKGFCSKHAWQIREYGNGNPLACALVYSRFFQEFLQAGFNLPEEEFKPELPAVPSNMRPALKELKPEGECPLCVYQEEVEERYLRSLVNFIQDREFAILYSQSAGVCRPHFLRIHKLFCPRDIKHLIVRRFFRTAQEIFRELEELKEKYNYSFSPQVVGAEQEIWVRVIGFWHGNL